MSSPLPSAAARAEGALGREATVPGLLRAACRELVELLDASGCVISRVIGELLVELVEHSRDGKTMHLGHGYLVPDYPLTQEVIERGQPRLVSLLDDEPDPNEARLLRELGFDSLLMLPLPAGGECWGLVEVYASGRRFETEEARTAEHLVAHAGRLMDTLNRRDNGAPDRSRGLSA